MSNKNKKLRPIKEKLDSLHFSGEVIDQEEIPILCGRIEMQLQNYEKQITNKLKECQMSENIPDF